MISIKNQHKKGKYSVIGTLESLIAVDWEKIMQSELFLKIKRKSFEVYESIFFYFVDICGKAEIRKREQILRWSFKELNLKFSIKKEVFTKWFKERSGSRWMKHLIFNQEIDLRLRNKEEGL